jgi:hypothetical protein
MVATLARLSRLNSTPTSGETRMLDRIRRTCAALLPLTLGAVLLAPAAQADFLGLQTGDLIDTMGYTITPGNGVFDDSADTLDVSAQADDITTTGFEVLTEINGGAIEVNLDLAGETLIFQGSFSGTYVYNYTATFTGRAGVDDITLSAPTGGPLPEQDGRLLISGEILTAVSVSISFDTLGLLGTPTTTFGGTFAVTGGDATFQQAFGMMGDLADIIGITTTSSPGVATLLTDGFLFSQRDTDLGAGGCGSLGVGQECVGNVIGQGGSYTFGGNGEVVPQSPAPFVPEPTTFTMLGLGLVGWAALGRRR